VGRALRGDVLESWETLAIVDKWDPLVTRLAFSKYACSSRGRVSNSSLAYLVQHVIPYVLDSWTYIKMRLKNWISDQGIASRI
jgi:hypothetical protein